LISPAQPGRKYGRQYDALLSYTGIPRVRTIPVDKQPGHKERRPKEENPQKAPEDHKPRQPDDPSVSMNMLEYSVTADPVPVREGDKTKYIYQGIGISLESLTLDLRTQLSDALSTISQFHSVINPTFHLSYLKHYVNT